MQSPAFAEFVVDGRQRNALEAAAGLAGAGLTLHLLCDQVGVFRRAQVPIFAINQALIGSALSFP
jgi:hypothetical protein